MLNSPHPDDADTDFDLAVAAHQSGDLTRAESIYRRLLQDAPQDPILLQLLGTALADSGRPREGLPLLRSSVRFDDENGVAWAQLAIAELASGATSRAIDAWMRAWDLERDAVSPMAAAIVASLEAAAPNRPELWRYAGEARLAMGDRSGAEVGLGRAIRHPPSADAARTTLGGVLLMSGRVADSIAILRGSDDLETMSVGRRLNLAQAHLLNGAADEAVQAAENLELTTADERRAAALVRGQALRVLGRLEEAHTCVATALASIENDTELVLLAATIDQDLGDPRAAVDRLRTAIGAGRGDHRLHALLAGIQVDHGRSSEALETISEFDGDEVPWAIRAIRAVALALLGDRDAALAIVRQAIGKGLEAQDRLRLARAAVAICHEDTLGEQLLRETIESTPDCVPARRELARLLLAKTLPEDALAVLEGWESTARDRECRAISLRCRIELGHVPLPEDWDRCVGGDQTNRPALSDVLLTLQYPAGISEESLATFHRQWSRTLPEDPSTVVQKSAAPRTVAARRPLRVAFYSADLRRHSVASFLVSWLDAVDRARMLCIGLDLAGAGDAVAATLRRQFAEWHDVRGLGNDRLRELAATLEIDVLIELGGHTANSGLRHLSPRVAPVQVSWLGYPNTTGLDTIDYRIVDRLTDPMSQAWPGVERLLHLAPPFLCYQPPAVEVDVPAPVDRPLTFGSFNNLHKVSDHTIALWTSTVLAVPESRLVLKARGLDDARVRRRLTARFVSAGLDEERLELLGPCPDTSSHLASYHGVDIALDPFPYHGTTTTCEALWMGVPIVSRVGEAHRSRVGLTLLHAVGLEDLAANSDAAFVEAAAALWADRQRRDTLRRQLRDRLTSSRLCDAARFADRFASAMETAIEGLETRT